MFRQIKIDQFEGPFDVLLNLINEKELDITQVALSEVTEQYLAYLDSLDESKIEELMDFLVVAAKLLHYKSRKIIPQIVFEEDESESDDLARQLKLYESFQKIAKKINRLWRNERQSFFRVEPVARPTEFIPPSNLTAAGLRDGLIDLLKNITPKQIPSTKIDKTIKIKEKIKYLISLLRKDKSVDFKNMIRSTDNKTEVVVGFIAVLELVKRETISLKQSRSYGNILIEKI